MTVKLVENFQTGTPMSQNIMLKRYINICHWNIEGLVTKNNINFNKLHSDKFIELAKNNDIICISETHIGEDENIHLNGFKCLKLCRKINKVNNRFYGGIAIFYKEELKSGIKFLNHKNDDYIWIKLSKDFFNTKTDYYLCYAYIPPSNSTYYQTRLEETWDHIEKEIELYSNAGSVIIFGDLNGRTASKPDFIKQDTLNNFENTLYYETDNIHERNSEDKINNTRGIQILESCIGNNLRIVNGRKLGDLLGKYTCHKFNGSSTVDYVIVSESSYNKIPFLKVGDFDGSLSDHCSLSWALITDFQLPQRRYNSYKPFPPKFTWKPEYIHKFQNHLTSHEATEKIKKFMETPINSTMDIENGALFLQSILNDAGRATIPIKKEQTKSKHKNKRWYDNELKDLKKTVIQNGRILQQHPYNTNYRKKYYETLTKYNKLRKRKARQFKADMIKKLNYLQTTNPSDYWKLLKEIRNENHSNKILNIPIPEWELHFKNLNNSSETPELWIKALKQIEGKQIFNETDFKITPLEISKSIKLLKNKKAQGIDNILNEMIKYSQNVLLPIYAKLFNSILCEGIYPDIWRDAYITPIFKKGDDLDTNNYRGITIMSNVAKLFNTILQCRLVKFFEDQKLIDHKQIAFKKEKRTSDHIFTIKTIIQKYMGRKKKLYCCFVDFRQAFDRVKHYKLLYKLRKTEMGSKMYTVIKNMYTTQRKTLQVKIGNHLSHKFTSNIGVKQGDPLSPILFNFYIDELKNYIKEDEFTPKLENVSIPYLFWADDLVLFSTSKLGLQNNLNSLKKYCEDWDMEVNTNKTKTMIFNTCKQMNEHFYFGHKKLDLVLNYKYLGIILQSNGKISDCTKDLYHRSLKAMFKLTKSLKAETPNFNTSMHLFDHLIKPILSYSSETWAPFLLKGKPVHFEKHLNFDIEKCHIKFMRYAIGINKRSPNFSIYGETGRFPLSIDLLCNSLKYYNRLLDMDEGSILHCCLLENMKFKQKDTWITNIKLLCNNSMVQLGKKHLQINQIRQHLQNMFKDWWKNKLFDDKGKENGNKLRSYRTYKDKFIKEEYLNITNNKHHRSIFAKLRLSCHKLNIETGRYAKKEARLAPELRTCNHCNTNNCEDEFHFLTTCPFYENERQIMMENIIKIHPQIINYDNKQLYIWLMANLDPAVINLTTKYVYESYIKRSNSTKNT